MHCELDILLLVADIDECATGAYTCGSNAYCSNNVGSYDCFCDSGYTGNGYTGCSGEKLILVRHAKLPTYV